MTSTSPKGSLVVVGTGIQAGRQMTRESIARLKIADVIMYCLSEPFTQNWILDLRPDAHDLSRFYDDGKDRSVTYEEMVEAILTPVREGKNVVAAFYGHPGIYVSPSFEAIKRARAEGYRSFMQPGISAEACLFADLGIDPAINGLLSYEASEWLVFSHKLDPSCSVILWQVDCVGDITYQSEGYDCKNVPVLQENLLRYYDSNHLAYLYQAAVLPVGRPKVWPVKIGNLYSTLRRHYTAGTLYIPPAIVPQSLPEMRQRLGLDSEACLDSEELVIDQNMPSWSLDPSFHIIIDEHDEKEESVQKTPT